MISITGFCPIEGQDIALEAIFNKETTNRFKIFATLITNNIGLDENSVFADITEATGGTFAPVELVDGNWTGAAQGAGAGFLYSYPLVTINGPFDNDITGHAIYAQNSAGTVKKLLYVVYTGEISPISSSFAYTFIPKVLLEAGADGQLTDEGADVMLDIVLNGVARVADLDAGLYTDTDLTGASVEADATAPTGTYPGDSTITDGTWVVSNGEVKPPAVISYTATGGAFTGNPAGVKLSATVGVTTSMLYFDDYASGPVVIVEDDVYSYDLTTST